MGAFWYNNVASDLTQTGGRLLLIVRSYIYSIFIIWVFEQQNIVNITI